MNIRSASVYSFELPLIRPVTTGAGGSVRRGLLLELKNEAGHVGWGEASPLPGVSVESLDEAKENLVAVASALEKGALEIEMLPSVRFAVEGALADLGDSLSEVGNRAVPVNALIDLSSGAIEQQVADAVDLGFDTLKLKVARGDSSGELWLIDNIRKSAGPDIRLRLDANRGWSYEEATSFLKSVSEYDIEYIEEPLHDPAGLVQLMQEADVRIALDETLSEITPEALSAYAGAAAAVIKPTILGGMERTAEWAEAARANSITPVISAVFESGVGIRHLSFLAARIMDEGVATGLDTYRWLTNDVLVKAIRTSRGCIEPNKLFKYGVHHDMLTGITDG